MKVAPGSVSNGKYQIMAEINMIPFIDVALVLLIIFMVITPFLVRSQIRVNLPRSRTADLATENEKPLEIQVVKDGTVYIHGQSVAPDEIESTLRRLLPSPETQPVVIQADKETSFEHVVKVMGTAKKIGATKLGVSVRLDVGSPSSGKPRKPGR